MKIKNEIKIKNVDELNELLEQFKKDVDKLKNFKFDITINEVKNTFNMNIQEAVKEGIKQRKMIARKSISYLAFIPTNDVFKRIMVVDIKNRRLPGKGWQPDANDLLANDWYVTDRDIPKE